MVSNGAHMVLDGLHMVPHGYHMVQDGPHNPHMVPDRVVKRKHSTVLTEFYGA